MQARLPCPVTNPYQKNPEFIGGKTLLAQMQSALNQNQNQLLGQRTFAICGLGGMGKTQVTIQYVSKHKDDFRVILWAHADSLARLAESFRGSPSSWGCGRRYRQIKAQIKSFYIVGWKIPVSCKSLLPASSMNNILLQAKAG